MAARRQFRWPALAYSFALIACAAICVWVWVVPGLRGPLTPLADQSAALMAGVLLLAACVTGLFTLQYPGRPNVSMALLPGLLSWWLLPPGTGAAITAFGQLFGNAWRRAPALQSLAGAARTLLAYWVATSLAGRLVPAAESLGSDVSLRWLEASVLFATVLTAADFLLDDAARRLSPATSTHPRLRRGFTGWAPASEAGPWGRAGRMDPLVNVLVLPLAGAFYVVYLALGFERMAIVLAGMLALLLVVRSLTNLRTAYGTLAEQRAKLATLFDHSGEGIFTVDGQLQVDAANPAMAALLGVPADAVAGRACAGVCRFEDLHGQTLCPERCPLVQAHATGVPVTMEVLRPVPDEPPRHLLLTYASVAEEGEPLSLGIGIARDMTAEREAQQLRDEFVSLVTHELRSPLTVSIGYLDLLKRSLGGEDPQGLDPQKGLYYAGRIEGAERHLLRLVNNLLELARVERPDLELELEWVEINDLVRETAEGASTLASGKRQTLTLDVPEQMAAIWSSELYLKEILSNLVSNAVKYTPEGGSVTVTLRDNRSGVGGDGAGESNWVEVQVVDTGYGMSPEELAKLFGKFFRSGRPEIRKERGTGLGLALTRSMVEKIGGSISVASELGKGSTFTVRLPATTPSIPAQPGPPSPEFASSRYTQHVSGA